MSLPSEVEEWKEEAEVKDVGADERVDERVDERCLLYTSPSPRDRG